ncbi:MAG: CHASE domain-containing protein, partial [Pseudomonadota bacterium]|nr:CHASE domain-containing protein [Pseudomonadota bacterium]
MSKLSRWPPYSSQVRRSARALAAEPLLVFAIALLVTGLLVAGVAVAIRQQNRSTFENEVERTLDAFDQRIRTTSNLLRGTAGLFAASEEVDAREFRDYVETLGLRERYPGILGIGFSRHVPSEELAQFEARARADGSRGFQVWPGHPRDEYHSIVFLEP